MNQQRYFFCYFLLFFTAIFFIQNNLWSQVITKSYTIPNFDIHQYEYENRQVKWLTFDHAIASYEYPSLPVLWDKIEVNNLYISYKYSLFNAKYESLTAEETALIPAEYVFAEPYVNIKTTTDEKRHYAMLSIVPVVKTANGQYQRLVSCDIRFEGAEPVRVTKFFGLKNSVLASGSWYKIAVSNTGLYKITYNDLKNLGINVSGLRSANIALFGNGGGMIPDVNPVEQIDDLLEVPIMIKDNGNGVFDENSYIVFYAQGPNTWEYNDTNGIFSHKKNIYSDNAYYFINVEPSVGEKKRVVKKNFLNETANKDASSCIYYDFYEKDEHNFEESGREWFGELFSASITKTYTFTLPELYDNQSGRVKVRVAATSPTTSNMELSWGGNNRTFVLNGIGSSSAYTTIFEQNNLPFNAGTLTFSLKFNSPQTSASARLDYIEIQAKCKLRISGNAMPFALIENIDASGISSVTLNNASAQTIVWDVTDPNTVYALEGKLTGTQFLFHTPTDKLRRFIAFNGTEYKTVTTVGKIATQNLHGLKDVDMVIVAHPDFVSEANRLAQFRTKTNNLNVKVVTPEQVYNEFSSGAQDPAAIRNFMRYLYDNDAQTIKYLLLFGRPSYDYRGLVTNTQLFVPNYQSTSSLGSGSLNTGLSCDDYFGILGINEGDLNKNTINVGVGRFPVSTPAQAKIAVDKTINASVRYKITPQNASQVSNFGDWRNFITLIADDEDNGDHLHDAEYVATIVTDSFPSFNLDKIYCDAYQQVSYAGGQRYPDVNKAINMRMDRGTLVIAYFGHGGGNGLAHERILEIADINSWKNKYNQPLMITLTCSFAWYDKQAISPAELVFLNEKGGASSLYSTSRVSYSGSRYGRQLFREIGSKWNGRYKTLGEIHRFAKNNNGGTEGNSNMIFLMGDPAMTINIPTHQVKTEAILDDDSQKIDTLKALSKVTVKGKVIDDAGNILSNFNGNIYPSIFDKFVKQKTLGQDPRSPIEEFLVQKNLLFKGNATVTNGMFEFSFFVPKDINFEYGNGKISYYAASDNDDAGDYYDNFFIGGISDKPLEDDKGPDIAIFLNDDKFVPGGITNPDPVLILNLKDEYGINTTGNGIGHDIVAILDNDIEKQMVLNDYYLADQDSYNSGSVRYPLQDLTPGTHTLKVRAWDICNNPSEASIDFVVKSDEKLELAHVLNYPNPFTTRTSFYFEHNQPAETFDILIHIFTISGKLVKSFQTTQFLEGNNNHQNPIIWDGRDEYGDKIGKGVYIYRLTVRNSQGETAEKIEKIAIL
ncbi:MAG: type IX secretion system sortase PorU [Lentimicrobiaceae bacterium]|nr:type IX secretion system sortase PorU [Lentimicrobiaceae bacterium]